MGEPPAVILVRLAEHHSEEVRRLSMGLEGPYLERCWMHLVGPTAVAFLRAVARAGDPTRLELGDLAAALGVRSGRGSPGKPLWRAINRLARYGLVHWHENELDVYRHIAPLAPNQLARAPRLVQRAHSHLLATR